MLLTARCIGGTLDGTEISRFVLDEQSLTTEGCVRLAVEEETGRYEAVGVVCRWPTEEGTYRESARWASALARTWHVEEYVYDHSAKTRWSGETSIVYRFADGFGLDAVREGARCAVRVGDPLILAADGLSVSGTRDEWATRCTQVDQACDAFTRISALLCEAPLSFDLSGPVAAMEARRVEARRLASLGAELEGVFDPDGSLEVTLNQVADQLEAIRCEAVDALRMLSDVRLDVPKVFPDEIVAGGALDLAALSGGITELRERSGS